MVKHNILLKKPFITIKPTEDPNSKVTSVTFLVVHFLHLLFNKSHKRHHQRIFFEKIPKRIITFEKESYEITKIFGEFGQICNFFLLKLSYLVKRF
jgi:hypothetical protein